MSQRYEFERSNLELQLGIIVLLTLIMIGALIYENYLLAVIIVIATLILKYAKKNELEYIPIEINNRGISINNEFVEYEKFVCFYVDDANEESDYLLLKSNGTLFKDVSVIIIEPEVDIEEMRTFLSQHLTEKKIKQNSMDKLMNAF